MGAGRARRGGFSLVEAVVALAVFAVGALVAVALLAGGGRAEERSKDQILAYKACQEVMEVLMTMDKATLLLQRDSGQALEFSATSLDAANPPVGAYGIVDVTDTLKDAGDTAAPADTIVEVWVSLEWKNARARLTARRTF